MWPMPVRALAEGGRGARGQVEGYAHRLLGGLDGAPRASSAPWPWPWMAVHETLLTVAATASTNTTAKRTNSVADYSATNSLSLPLHLSNSPRPARPAALR